jgi:hypothetical protein
MNFNIKKYIEDIYTTTKTSDLSDHNDFYDWIAYVNHRIIKFELKEREEIYDDILVEVLQKVKKPVDILFEGLKENPTANELHIAVGWFYKTDCDRFIYVNPKYVYDIDWIKFKQLVWDKKGNFETRYCELTTGTWNWVVPLNIMPESIYFIKDNIWNP